MDRPRRGDRDGSSNSETLFDYDNKLKAAIDIETQMSAEGFWNNQEKAQATVAELKALKSLLRPLDDVSKSADDLEAMIEMADDEPSFAAEVPRSRPPGRLLVDLELKGLLNGPYDVSRRS